MSNLIYKYRIWCETDQRFEEKELSEHDPPLAVCPVNEQHVVKTDKGRLSIIETREDVGFEDLSEQAGFQFSEYWLSPVKSKTLNTPPTEPLNGDRYIVATDGSGSWLHKDKYIQHFNASTGSWVAVAPKRGMVVEVEGESQHYQYNGLNWVSFGLSSRGQSIDADFAEVSTIAEKSGSSWGTLLEVRHTPKSSLNKYLVRFDASMGLSTNSDRKVDFRLMAGSGTPSQIRGTYASSDKSDQVANAALTCRINADSEDEHIFRIEWRIRSGNGTVTINPQSNIYEHASLLIQEVKG